MIVASRLQPWSKKLGRIRRNRRRAAVGAFRSGVRRAVGVLLTPDRWGVTAVDRSAGGWLRTFRPRRQTASVRRARRARPLRAWRATTGRAGIVAGSGDSADPAPEPLDDEASDALSGDYERAPTLCGDPRCVCADWGDA
jgi:hypothetical protein